MVSSMVAVMQFLGRGISYRGLSLQLPSMQWLSDFTAFLEKNIFATIELPL
jgi:hypothetical protein